MMGLGPAVTTRVWCGELKRAVREAACSSRSWVYSYRYNYRYRYRYRYRYSTFTPGKRAASSALLPNTTAAWAAALSTSVLNWQTLQTSFHHSSRETLKSDFFTNHSFACSQVFPLVTLIQKHIFLLLLYRF